jgi:hypothetical protein
MGTWTPAINRAELQAGRTGWTFYFYLPSSAQLAAVAVNRGGSAQITEVKGWETLPETVNDGNWDEDWLVDSGAAIANFTGPCLNGLSADASVLAVFTTSADNNSLMWNFQTVNSDGTISCEVKVDAESGAVR